MIGGSSLGSVPVRTSNVQESNAAATTQQPASSHTNIPTAGRDSLLGAPGGPRTANKLRNALAATRAPTSSPGVSTSNTSSASSATEAAATENVASPTHGSVQQLLDQMATTTASIEQHISGTANEKPASQVSHAAPTAGGQNLHALTEQLNALHDRFSELHEAHQDALRKNHEMQDEVKKLTEQSKQISDEIGTAEAKSLVNAAAAACQILSNAQDKALRLII